MFQRCLGCWTTAGSRDKLFKPKQRQKCFGTWHCSELEAGAARSSDGSEEELQWMTSLQAEPHVGTELSPLKLLPWGSWKSWRELPPPSFSEPGWEVQQRTTALPEATESTSVSGRCSAETVSRKWATVAAGEGGKIGHLVKQGWGEVNGHGSTEHNPKGTSSDCPAGTAKKLSRALNQGLSSKGMRSYLARGETARHYILEDFLVAAYDLFISRQ